LYYFPEKAMLRAVSPFFMVLVVDPLSRLPEQRSASRYNHSPYRPIPVLNTPVRSND
jgi:hypothetical protein